MVRLANQSSLRKGGSSRGREGREGGGGQRRDREGERGQSRRSAGGGSRGRREAAPVMERYGKEGKMGGRRRMVRKRLELHWRCKRGKEEGGREKLQHPDVLQGLRESRKTISNFYFRFCRCYGDSICNKSSFQAPPFGQMFLFLSWLLGQQFLQESPATSSRRFQGLQGQDGKSDLFSSSRWSPPSRTCPKHLPGESAGNIRPNTPPPTRQIRLLSSGGSTPSAWRMSELLARSPRKPLSAARVRDLILSVTTCSSAGRCTGMSGDCTSPPTNPGAAHSKLSTSQQQNLLRS